MVLYCLFIIAAALVGGAVPLLLGRSHRAVNGLIAISAGFFLGVVFAHMLPEVALLTAKAEAAAHAEEALHGERAEAGEHAGEEEGHEHGAESETSEEAAPSPHGHGSRRLWLWVLVGLLAIYLVEKLVLASRDGTMRDQHVTLSLGSAFGLGTHALTAGLGLAAAGTRPEILGPLFYSIVAHKSVEAFSLVSVLMLAEFPRRRVVLFAALFSLVTPLGVLLGSYLFQGASDAGVAILISLATGTFLFVAVCDLLPEVFHHRSDMLPRLALLVLGVLVSLWI